MFLSLPKSDQSSRHATVRLLQHHGQHNSGSNTVARLKHAVAATQFITRFTLFISSTVTRLKGPGTYRLCWAMVNFSIYGLTGWLSIRNSDTANSYCLTSNWGLYLSLLHMIGLIRGITIINLYVNQPTSVALCSFINSQSRWWLALSGSFFN